MHPLVSARPVAAPLVWASLFALPTAALAPRCLPVAAGLVVLGILFARFTRHRCRLAGLCALPALLVAVDPPARPFPWPRPGPVAVDGAVADVVRNPRTNTVAVRLGSGRGDVRMHFDVDLDVLPGDRLRAMGRLAAPPAPDLLPTLHGTAATAQITPGPWSLGRTAATARRTLERHLLRLFPGERGAMLASLVLGRATLPSSDLTAAHQATGLSHLLAVSGAHAAMLALLLGLRARAHRIDASRGRTVLVVALLCAYAAITGNEPPVLRALVAFALAAVAARLGRPLGLAAGLLAPALVTALLQPAALLGPSFLLSYAAVVGLHVAGAPAHDGAPRNWLVRALRSSLWATLLTAPLTLHFFGQVAPWTVLLTPLLAPLVAVMLLGGLATAILAGVLPPVAECLAVPLDVATALYVATVQAADRLPGTPVHALAVPPPWLLVLAAAGAFLLIERRAERRRIALAAGLLMVPHFVPLPRTGAERFVLFAVGHGQAGLLVGADGHQTAIDCGSLQHPTLAARRLTEALVHRRLDLLVVTHADEDHHNGVPALLQRVPIAAALLPRALLGSPLAATLMDHGTRVAYLAPGEHGEPAPHLHIAVPALPEGASDNDTSAWVRARFGNATVLLTGDAEALGTAAAIAQGLALPSEVLVLPHHGRPNPAAAALLQRVRPHAALASADGADGDTALGGTARAFGADLWITGVHGTIEVRTDGSPRIRGSLDGRPLPRRLR